MEVVEHLIVGSGPAATSAAHALLTGGRSVVMLHPGRINRTMPPEVPFWSFRERDSRQHEVMIGPAFEALTATQEGSPKRRVPALAEVFSGYNESNKIEADGFHVWGALAEGGLTTAWGAGAAAFSDAELSAFPVKRRELDGHYVNVVRRVGVSGPKKGGDLVQELGLPIEALQPPIGVSGPGAQALRRYVTSARRHKEFIMGDPCNAVSTLPLEGRGECTRLGTCLWGCPRRAIYSAEHDMPALRRFAMFGEIAPALCRRLERHGDSWGVVYERGGGEYTVRARRVLLGAGTLASTRLALDLLGHAEPVRLLHNPVAAFLLFSPSALGSAPSYDFALAQVAFRQNLVGLHGSVHGHLFNASSVPMSELAGHIPLSRRNAVSVMSHLHSACLLGLAFLPGELSSARVQIDSQGNLNVHGIISEAARQTFAFARRALSKSLLRAGLWMVPGSFQVPPPGSDAHYAGTLPMQNGDAGFTSRWGELNAASGVFVVDASTFPTLPSKPHTLTIMANAERIGAYLARMPVESSSRNKHA